MQDLDHEIITSTGQYENIKTHFCGTPEDAVELSEKMKTLVAEGSGLSDKEFRDAIDLLVQGKAVPGGIEMWEKMTKYQKAVCKEIDKSLKRINYKK